MPNWPASSGRVVNLASGLTGAYLVAADMGSVEQVRDPFDGAAREGVADESQLARAGLPVPGRHREDGAVVLGDPPAPVIEPEHVGEVPILVEDVRQLGDLVVEAEPGEPGLGVVEPPAAAALEQPGDLGAPGSPEVSEQLGREIGVTLGEEPSAALVSS